MQYLLAEELQGQTVLLPSPTSKQPLYFQPHLVVIFIHVWRSCLSFFVCIQFFCGNPHDACREDLCRVRIKKYCLKIILNKKVVGNPRTFWYYYLKYSKDLQIKQKQKAEQSDLQSILVMLKVKNKYFFISPIFFTCFSIAATQLAHVIPLNMFS